MDSYKPSVYTKTGDVEEQEMELEALRLAIFHLMDSSEQCWGSGSACFWASRIRINYSEEYGSGSFPFLMKVLSRMK
jgi:hypothetical protein